MEFIAGIVMGTVTGTVAGTIAGAVAGGGAAAAVIGGVGESIAKGCEELAAELTPSEDTMRILDGQNKVFTDTFAKLQRCVESNKCTPNTGDRRECRKCVDDFNYTLTMVSNQTYDLLNIPDKLEKFEQAVKERAQN